MSTAQRLREAAVSFPMKYFSDLDSQIYREHFDAEDEQWPYSVCQQRMFMLIVACSLDGGET